MESTTIGQRIKELRVKAGYSQDELAKLCGYSDKSAINKIEMGHRDPTHSKVFILSKVFGVSPGYLMGWDDKPPDISSFTNPTDALKNDEREMLDLYRQLSPRDQGRLLGYAQCLVDKYNEDFEKESS